MQRLFAPWRFEYVTHAEAMSGCIFCEAVAGVEGALTLIREDHAFALLNRYPYTSGHSMVAPLRHVGDLDELEETELASMMRLVQRVTAALREVYHPHAFNLGMNLGESAGAGIPEHLHMHVVPRWRGDTSFMTVTGDVRVIPEDLATTLEKVRGALGVHDG